MINYYSGLFNNLLGDYTCINKFEPHQHFVKLTNHVLMFLFIREEIPKITWLLRGRLDGTGSNYKPRTFAPILCENPLGKDTTERAL